MTYIEKIYNIETGQESVRNYSPLEIEQVNAAKEKLNEEMLILNEKATLKKVILDRLGITEEEAKLLLG